MKTHLPESALLNKAETASLIRCSIRHLENMTNKGLIPAPVRIGTAPRYRRDELMQWIADGCLPVRDVTSN